jgi:glycerol-3-phosphate dehydrogenase (NAD(P)+)
VAIITVFGSGAMGTAVAMHLARAGNDTTLWASEWDAAVLPALLGDRRHPGLPEHLPDQLRVLGPEDLAAAGDGVEIAVMGAHSGGARTLSRTVHESHTELPVVVGLAKGLEHGTGRRMSEIYAEEIGHDRVVAMGGPALASEIAQDLPTAAVLASADEASAEFAAGAFRSGSFHVIVSTDVPGVEYATVAKNVTAIGMGMLDGFAKVSNTPYRNAKAALFTQAVDEMRRFLDALGAQAETAVGLAGLGDALVTSLGGRNRLYGELLGEGAEPEHTLRDLVAQGLTVEGVESAREVRRLTDQLGLDLPLHSQVHRILFEGMSARSILDCLKG